MEICIQYYKSSLGELILGSFQDKLCLCDWRYRKMRQSVDDRLKKHIGHDFKECNSEVITTAINQLDEYFIRQRKEFDIPLLFAGSKFQVSVWNELLQIPYGSTQSYLGLAKQMSNEKAIRAIATANGANAHAIIVPCHRIIGSDNSLVGYAGGLAAKKKLLEIEGADLDKGQLKLF